MRVRKQIHLDGLHCQHHLWAVLGDKHSWLAYLMVDFFPRMNRQYSYSPTVLGRVGLDHECEAHAGNFSPRGQTNMRKLRLSLLNLRILFNIVKFRRAYTLERRHHYLKQQRKICSLLLTKTAILIIIILMRRVLGERVYNLI